MRELPPGSEATRGLPGGRGAACQPERARDAKTKLSQTVGQVAGVSVRRRKAEGVRRSAGGDGTADAAGLRGIDDGSIVTDRDVRGGDDDGFHAGGTLGGAQQGLSSVPSCNVVTSPWGTVRARVRAVRGGGSGGRVRSPRQLKKSPQRPNHL